MHLKSKYQFMRTACRKPLVEGQYTVTKNQVRCKACKATDEYKF